MFSGANRINNLSKKLGPITLSSLTATSVTTSNSATFTLPAASAGKIGILFDCSGGTTTSLTPTGWTNIHSTTISTAPTIQLNISYKILTASDNSATVTSLAPGTSKICYTIAPNAGATITTVTIAGLSTGDTIGTNAPALTTNPSGGTLPLMVFGGYTQTSFQGSGAWSPAINGGSGQSIAGSSVVNYLAFWRYSVGATVPSSFSVDPPYFAGTPNTAAWIFYLQAS